MVKGRKDIGLAIVQDIPNNNKKGLVSARPSNKPRQIIKKNKLAGPADNGNGVFSVSGKEGIYFLRDGMQKSSNIQVDKMRSATAN